MNQNAHLELALELGERLQKNRHVISKNVDDDEIVAALAAENVSLKVAIRALEDKHREA